MMQEQAETQLDLLVKQMAEQEGVTEHLKEENQMLWVQRMNNIRERAECQTAHCGRCKTHFIFGETSYPIVPYRNLPQILDGLTAHCCSLV